MPTTRQYRYTKVKSSLLTRMKKIEGQAKGIQQMIAEGRYCIDIVQQLSAFSAAAGARLEYRWGDIRYAPMRNNLTLSRLFQQNMQSLGRKIKLFDPDSAFGSTDMGNGSQLVPGIHPMVAIAPKEVEGHSTQFVPQRLPQRQVATPSLLPPKS